MTDQPTRSRSGSPLTALQRRLCRGFRGLVAGLFLAGGLASARAESPVVAVVKGDHPDQMVAQAVELLGGLKDLFRDGRSVVIKPNLTSLRGDSPYPGETTDPRVARGLVKVIKSTANCRLSLAEGLNAGNLWDATGFAQLARDEGMELTNIAAGRFLPVPIDGLALKEYRYPELIKQCDVFIDLPVMKTHRLTGTSAGMKNLYGLLPFPRDVLHSDAERVLPDLVQIRKPDLVLVDALVAMEGQGPLDGTSVPMNLVVAGRDIVAVDTVCAAIMGIDPGQIQYLNYAKQRGLGENDLKKIAVRGVPIEQVMRKFKLARWFIRMELPGTAELGQRIRSLADKVTELDSGRGGWLTEFKPERLKIDRKKYPAFESSGFTVMMDRRARRIQFEAQYEVPSLVNRAATEESLKNWITENLGSLGPAMPTVLPLGG